MLASIFMAVSFLYDVLGLKAPSYLLSTVTLLKLNLYLNHKPPQKNKKRILQRS